jgi:hypothetical protein
MTISNSKTSLLVSTQLPDFVRDDHPRFVEFLEAYYKFMEQTDGAINQSKLFLNNLDVDQASNTYLDYFYSTFIKFIPNDIQADRVLLMKHIKDFYLSRGTERSIRFLCRLAFNKEIEFYYPKVDILRASDGKWYVKKVLKVEDIQVNNVSNTLASDYFASKMIYGRTSNAFATIERLDSYYDRGDLINELEITNQNRQFLEGEQVYTFFQENGEVKMLSANIIGGVIDSVSIVNPGSGYTAGTIIPISAYKGSGAEIVIASTTTGTIDAVVPLYGGAGFKTNDPVLFIGGGGSGAIANVAAVDKTGFYHPNSYNIVNSTISLEANTLLSNAKYTNLRSSNANVTISNSVYTFLYDNCGPISGALTLGSGGSDYTSLPTMDVLANTYIRDLGILGRMEIANGGINYTKGDLIEFINPPGGYGMGALANVYNTAANGMITEVHFVGMAGHLIGGSGYDVNHLPFANVRTSTGSAANIVVTCLLGDGESLFASTSTIGVIEDVIIRSGGSGYPSNVTLDLTGLGDGTANVVVGVTAGVYSYPGRYLNDDGHLSGYNFLEDRDYYQNYSYVVLIDESINKYQKLLYDLAHPAGMKLFGEYIYENNDQSASAIGVAIANTYYTSNT